MLKFFEVEESSQKVILLITSQEFNKVLTGLCHFDSFSNAKSAVSNWNKTEYAWIQAVLPDACWCCTSSFVKFIISLHKFQYSWLTTQNTSSTTRGVCFTVVKLLYMTIINSSVVLTPRSLSLEDPLSYEDLEIPAVCVSVASLCRFCTLWGMWYSLKFGICIIPLILWNFNNLDKC